MAILEIVSTNGLIIIYAIASIVLAYYTFKHYKENKQMTRLLQFSLMSMGTAMASINKYLEFYSIDNQIMLKYSSASALLMLILGMGFGFIAVFKHGPKEKKKFGIWILIYLLVLLIAYLILDYLY